MEATDDRLKQLQTWMDAREDEHLEFKEAKNSFNLERLTNYCVALANEGGGRLILGVTDQRPRRVVGSLAFPQPSQTAAQILTRLRFRVETEELRHPDGRVLVFNIPSRPIGVPVHNNGVYWMRSDEELVAMTPDQLKRILDEGEPDYSAGICEGALLEDLDPAAIERFRSLWLQKSKNTALQSLSHAQLLTDAELLIEDRVTKAAMLMFGTRQRLGRHQLAHAEVIFEYRSQEASGPPAQREEFRQGFLQTLDALWSLINLRNDRQSFQDGLIVLDISTFNERAVREAILNAVVHREYRQGGSVFVRQYPRRLEIVSPGGFPPGITTENVLWKQNPRNRRIAEAVARCGLVERSGQGMNLMYEECIRESKPVPDFTGTDDYDVSVTLNGEVQDARFLRFLEKIGRERLQSFTTKEFLTLDLIHREQNVPDILRSSVALLKEQGIIEPAGRGTYILSRGLYSFLGQKGVYTRKRGLDRETNKALLLKHIVDNNDVGSKLDELLQVLPALTRRQVQRLLEELRKENKIHSQRRTKAARWHAGQLNETIAPEPV